MIGAVLTELAPRVSHADLVRTTDETLSVAVDADGIEILEDHADAIQVRAVEHGRLGWAAGSTSELPAVVAAALRSAAIGEPTTLFPPAPAGLAAVATSSPAARSLGAGDLIDLARRLGDRLARRGWTVETWAERSIGLVEVGNTRGVLTSYEVTLAGIGAVVAASGGPICRVHQARVGPPETADLERLVDEVEARLTPPVLDEPTLPPSGRVWFGPRAVRSLLEPVLARLTGDRWLTGPAGWTLDDRLTLIDDPHAAGRPGSRPICDDGVVTRPVVLIERGAPGQGIVDLVAASRHRVPATGHGWRRGFSAARTGFSNLILADGDRPADRLGAALGDGLFVPEFRFGPAPNPATGIFRVEVPWAFRVEGGRVVGRIDGVVLSGDAFELLGRVTAVGADGEWIGAARMPSLVVDGVRFDLR